MASGTVTPNKDAGPKKESGTDQCEAFIEERLLDTQRQVKGVDIADGLITLAIGALAYLLLVAMIDHWLVSGGLGFWGRFFLLLGLLAGGSYYFYLRVLPPLIRRINPVFAAHTIERGRPSLKNSLINFLLIRSQRKEMPKVIYHALQRRAAVDLTTVPPETTVDRGHVMRLAYVLIGTLAIFCLYLALSPKSPLTSAFRVIWPWGAIDAPTRVVIKDVKPGDTMAYHGEQVAVSAEVKGLRTGEPITLIYNTADGQTIDQAVPMTRPEGRYRYECKLPPGNIGFQQDYEYCLVAGDCRTGTFEIKVQIAPTITVDRVEYDYPAYTGLARSVDERQGDVRAIEGTKVTVHASANQQIKRAEIDLDCDGVHGLKMYTDGNKATGGFDLGFDPEIPSRPAHECYQLRFTDARGLANRQPTRYRIEVIPDLPPEVDVIEPEKDEVRIPCDGHQRMRFRAVDPDFAISSVRLRVEHRGRLMPVQPLLDQVHHGEFVGEYSFQPKRLGLKPGDRVRYWAEARDNKSPEPNRAETASRWIIVVGPEVVEPPAVPPNDPQHDPRHRAPQIEQRPQPQSEPQQPLEQPPQAEQQKPEQQPQPDQQARQQQREQKQEGKQERGEQAQEGARESRTEQQQPGNEGSTEPIDSKTQDGDAFEEILKHREKQQETGRQQNESQQEGGQKSGQQGTQQQKSKQQGEQQQDARQQGEQQSGQQNGQQNGQQQGEQQQGEQQRGQKPGQQQSEQQEGGRQSRQQGGQKQGTETDGQQGEQQQGGQQKGGQQQSGQRGEQQPGGQQQGGQKQGGQKQGGQQQGGQQQGGQQQGARQGEQKQGGQKQGGQQQGGQQQGGRQTGEQKQTEQKQGGQQQGSKQQGGSERKSQQGQQSGGRKQSEQQQSGQKQDGQKQGGQKQPGEKQAGKQSGGKQQGGQQQENRQQGGEQKGAQQQGGQQQKSEKKQGGKSEGSPAAQGGNKPKKEKKDGQSGKAGQGQSKKEKSKGKSPSGSEQQSEGKGETSGDQSGKGQEGGGQKSPQPGKGAAGSSTDADVGGAASNKQGGGQTGQRAGEQVETDRQTGTSATESDSKGAGKHRQRPGAGGEGRRPSEETGKEGGSPMQDSPPEGGQPGNQASNGPGATGHGNTQPGGGDNVQNRSVIPPKKSEAAGADKANLDYAKEATDLGLEHLRDQMKQPDSELLKRLGWTPEEARQFIERWEQMNRGAEQEGPGGDQARRARDDALRGLGLRPRGTELRGGNMGTNHVEKREATRHKPPGAWNEWMKAYTHGVAGEGR